MPVETKLTSVEIELLKAAAFDRESRLPQTYVVDAGLHAGPMNPVETARWAGYEDDLPRFRGRNLTWLIDELVAQAGGNQVRVLDVGCGSGKFLEDCRSIWLGGLELNGITAQAKRRRVAELSEMGINCVVGDAQRLGEIFPASNFDLIVSNWSLRLMPDQLSVIEQIWSLLDQDGIALLNNLRLFLSESEIDRLNDFSLQRGIDISLIPKISPIRKIGRLFKGPGEREFQELEVVIRKNTRDEFFFPVERTGVIRFGHVLQVVLYELL